MRHIETRPASSAQPFASVPSALVLTILGVALAAPARADSISPAASTVTGCTSLAATVSLSAPAPAGGKTFQLTSSSALATVPATVTVPAGALGAPFFISTSGVLTNTSVALTATSGSSVLKRNITLTPQRAASLTLSATRAPLDTDVVATMTFTCPALAGTVVNIAANNAAVTVPASINIPTDATSATFVVRTSSAAVASVAVAVTASTPGGSRVATLTVVPPSVQTMRLSPPSIVGGGTTQAICTMEFPAPAGGATVSLSSSAPSVAWSTQPSLVIPAGATTATFTIESVAQMADQVVTFTAAINGIATTKALPVKKNGISTVYVRATTLTPCRPAVIEIELVAAPSGQPVYVDVATSAPADAAVSTSRVEFAPGVRRVAFEVSALHRATENGTVSVSMTFPRSATDVETKTRSFITPRVSTRACLAS